MSKASAKSYGHTLKPGAQPQHIVFRFIAFFSSQSHGNWLAPQVADPLSEYLGIGRFTHLDHCNRMRHNLAQMAIPNLTITIVTLSLAANMTLWKWRQHSASLQTLGDES
jgi:hypothetical protein